MKPTIKDLKDSYSISITSYDSSRAEARHITNLYHNRQYSTAQVAALREKGQPAETFNVVKMLAHAIIGYSKTVANVPMIKPNRFNQVTPALLLNDTVQTILNKSGFKISAAKMKLDALLTGLMVVYYHVVDTGETDEMGRKIFNIEVEHVPSRETSIDPMSKRADRRDARYFHRWKWVSEETLKENWPNKVKKLEEKEYFNHLEDIATDFEESFGNQFQGKYRMWDNYLVVHSIVKDGDKTWSILWCDDVILSKNEMPFTNLVSPYRVVKVDNSDEAEHYGPFREVAESQDAINQAILQIQLLVNTSRALVEDGAVDDIDEFRTAFDRVNRVIEVVDLGGVQIDTLSNDVVQQYMIIDKALERIKMTIGVNDSFLGQAFASDSGRKVQMQSMSSASQLSWFMDKLEYMFEMIGTDLVGLIKQYYTAHQIIRISDPVAGDKFIELNAPMVADPVGLGNPTDFVYMFEEVVNPETGEIEEDEDGNILLAPRLDDQTSFELLDVDVEVIAVPFNNAEERNQALFETFLQGPVGQSLLQVNPSGYYTVAALQVSEYGTKHSQTIGRILSETAMMINQGQLDPSLAMYGGDSQAIMGGVNGGATGNPKSPTLSLGSNQA